MLLCLQSKGSLSRYASQAINKSGKSGMVGIATDWNEFGLKPLDWVGLQTHKKIGRLIRAAP